MRSPKLLPCTTVSGSEVSIRMKSNQVCQSYIESSSGSGLISLESRLLATHDLTDFYIAAVDTITEP